MEVANEHEMGLTFSQALPTSSSDLRPELEAPPVADLAESMLILFYETRCDGS